MCRGPISLFTLRNALDPESLAIERNTDTRSWPIFGQTYLQQPAGVQLREGPVGGYGLKFVYTDRVPGVVFTTPLHIRDPNDLDTDQGHISDMQFDEFHFHTSTMTFHGKSDTKLWTLKQPTKDERSNPTDTLRTFCPTYFYDKLECILQFSPDGRYIRDGFLSWSYFDTESLIQQYPLDGTWECEREGRMLKIYVQFHSFTLDGARCHFFINDINKVCFKLPTSSSPSVSVQKILPGSSGPLVGETLSWESNPGMSDWTRVSTNLKGASSVVRMKPIVSSYTALFVYQRETSDTNVDSLGPTYYKDSLWGNTFCQAFAVGLASYHFIKPDEDNDGNSNTAREYQAYISYENPKTSQWPNLDNGEPIPSRVPFRNIQWNEETRTFKGDILWMQDYGTTWTGHSKWMYEIIFDVEYRFIASGTCTMMGREPHRFGEDLVYINASMEYVLSKALLYSSSTEEYLDNLRDCRDAGASSETMQCLGQVALSVMDRSRGSCFDYNL